MIGALDPEVKEATVVGAGIAGLLAADRLERLGYQVTLLEASERAGGLIRTLREPLGLSESAAHSLLATPAVSELMRDLGIETVLVRDSRRYVGRRGRLRRFPLGPLELLAAFLKAYLMLADRSVEPSRMTLAQWGRRYLGSAATDYLLAPFLRGIYGARPSEVVVGAAFPRLMVPAGHSLLSAQLARRVTRRGAFAHEFRGGGGRMEAPREGMGALISALERRLEKRLGGRFARGRRIENVPDAPNVLLCVPAPEAAALLRTVDPTTSQALDRVTYAPIVSVTAFAPAAGFPKTPRGVGVLFAETEPRHSLGILFNSSAFPGRVANEGLTHSFTVLFGGSWRPELLEADDEHIRTLTELELREAVGFRGSLAGAMIHRHSRAIPRYDSILMDAWKTAHEGWAARPGRALFGNYTGQVSIRGMIETVSRW